MAIVNHNNGQEVTLSLCRGGISVQGHGMFHAVCLRCIMKMIMDIQQSQHEAVTRLLQIQVKCGCYVRM